MATFLNTSSSFTLTVSDVLGHFLTLMDDAKRQLALCDYSVRRLCTIIMVGSILGLYDMSSGFPFAQPTDGAALVTLHCRFVWLGC